MDFRRTCADVKAKAVDGNYACEILAGNYFDIWRKQNGGPSDIFRVWMKKEEKVNVMRSIQVGIWRGWVKKMT
ncbi:hypothetical protein CDAR_169951 [Caerostris darwini]|uniref:Uncharacterized protein n=1 Tax=Caerostris darwini TaxID=1538125 RepID=A0AAV4RQB3_9ARAC|nr:hypothetical protein CDAR_169951 [Caerostris darwini]